VRFLLSILAVLALAIPPAEAKRPEPDLPKPPPQPVPQKVAVARGGKVEITLRVYERLPPGVQFQIRTKPDWGKLTAPKPAQPNTATVTYEPPADLTVKGDKFLYASQTPVGVSAPAEVTITITDEPARLAVPDELKFEPLRAGQTSRQGFTIKNEGGSLAEGELEVDPPWKLLDHPGYSLGEGQQREFTVIFAPTEGGRVKREIRYTSQRDRVTTLIGEAVFPLSVLPARLELTREQGQTTRSGAVEIRNETDETQSVKVRASIRWKVPASVEIAAHSSAPLIFSLPPDDVQEVQETVKLTGDGIEISLPIVAPAVPAVLQADSKPARVTGSAPARVPVKNAGGANGYWDVTATPPFVLEVKELRLTPRQEAAVFVHLDPATPGHFPGELRFTGEHQTVIVPLDGEVAAGLPAAPMPKPAAPPPRRSAAPVSYSDPAPARPAAPERKPAADPDTLTGVPIPVVKDGVATLEWPSSLNEGQPVKAELRRFSMEGKKKLRIDWLELRDARITTGPAVTRAELHHLPQGQLSVVRFSALDPATKTARLLFQIPVVVPIPEPSSWLSSGALLTLLLLAAAGFFLYQRTRGNG
jgi:hypothetical protein